MPAIDDHEGLVMFTDDSKYHHVSVAGGIYVLQCFLLFSYLLLSVSLCSFYISVIVTLYAVSNCVLQWCMERSTFWALDDFDIYSWLRLSRCQSVHILKCSVFWIYQRFSARFEI